MKYFSEKNKGLVSTRRGGFTLVEMMVSISIFVIVAFTITATLVAVSNANRKAQELKQIMDNLNFSVQSMVLRMREGHDYTCANFDPNTDVFSRSAPQTLGVSCAGGDNAILFKDPSGTDVRYYLDADTSTASNKEYCPGTPTGLSRRIVKREIGAGGGAPSGPLDVTSPEVDICGLTFVVNNGIGAESTESKPYVTITIDGVAKLRSGESSKFNLRTFVSQHN